MAFTAHCEHQDYFWSPVMKQITKPIEALNKKFKKF